MKTIVFNLFNGFNARYLIETGIIDQLKKNKIILTSYTFDGIEDYLENNEDIIHYKLNKIEDFKFKKSFVEKNLNRIRYYIYGGNFKTPKLHFNLFAKDYLTKFSFKNFFYILILKFIILILNFIKPLRILYSNLIESCYPKYYKNLLRIIKLI